MPNKETVLVCPLCHGHGEIRQSELSDLFTGDGLRTRISRCLAAAGPTPQEDGDLVAAGARESGSRDFQKDVHSWNPQLPIWRRSPKE
jgi:hypothetical protein